MGMLQLLDVSPLLYAVVVVGVVASIVLHELGHAFAADAQGDPTPRMLGHFTWNPLVHMGWISLLLVALFGIRFGRTPVIPRNFRDRRYGAAKVSVAGPAVNLAIWILLAIALGVATRLAPEAWDEVSLAGLRVGRLVSWIASLNLVLFGFNMIPIPPFDGFDVFAAFLPIGEFGRSVRRLGMLPVVLVFLAVSQFDVFGVAFDMTDHVRVGTVILLGGG